MENFIVMKGGGATRAPGTRFVLELKDSAARQADPVPAHLDRLLHAGDQWRRGALRAPGRLLQNPDTTPYELTVPWVEAICRTCARRRPAIRSMWRRGGTKKPQTITRIDHAELDLRRLCAEQRAGRHPERRRGDHHAGQRGDRQRSP
jgi:hypothetical protein